MRRGIDVAKWQGEINWKKVKKDGIQFAILKVTNKKNETEEEFERNYHGAMGEGISVGAYRYVYAKTPEEAKREALAVVKTIKGKSIPEKIWIDVEDSGIKGIGKEKLTEIIETEAAIFRMAGFGAGIYCNKDWYDHVLDQKILAKTYPFWIARYPYRDIGEFREDSALNPRDIAYGWQYSSKGKVKGITGNVDLDVFYDEAVPHPPEIRPVHVQLNYRKGQRYMVSCGCLHVRMKPVAKDGVVVKGKHLGYKYKGAILKNGATMRLNDEIWMYIGLDPWKREQWLCADDGTESYLIS